MSIEVQEDDLLEYLLCVVSDHSNPKLIPYIDSHGQPLDPFKVSWAASVAEEQGQYPLISSPAEGVNYFVFFSKDTMLTGYLSFYPIMH